MSEVIFWINVFEYRGRYSVSNIYEEESKAIETGKMTEGYITTAPIKFERDVVEDKGE